MNPKASIRRAVRRVLPAPSEAHPVLQRLQARDDRQARRLDRLRERLDRQAEQVAQLQARVVELEEGLQEARQLNRHVAELVDIVAEVLLPTEQRDDEAVRSRLAQYVATL